METVVTPFNFFQLDINVQRDILLNDLDYESIKNLCAGAKLSKDPRAVAFFRELCAGEAFWQQKTERDFGVVEKKRPTWREEYESRLLSPLEMELFKAVDRAIFDRVQDLIEVDHVNINVRDETGSTPLMYAALSEGPFASWPLFYYLVKQGADLNMQNFDGQTALMHAAYADKPGLVRFLLKEGADPELVDIEGLTAKEWATGLSRRLLHKLEREKAALEHTKSSRAFRASRRSKPSTRKRRREDMTVKELRKVAKDHGLQGYSKLRKAELLAFLEKNLP